MPQLDTGREYDEPYDKLILAPGAAPLRPPIAGVDLPGILTLRNLHDADVIKRHADNGIDRAVVVGGGFIGLEMIENLVRRRIATTLVQLQDQVLSPFDREMTTPIVEELVKHDVQVILSDSAEAFEPASRGLVVRLKSGRSLAADLVIMGIGVRPESGLAVSAGLTVGRGGGIRVNDHLQTDDPDIYAVGDVIEVRDFVTELPAQVPLAGPANRQGRIAADNVLGRLALSRHAGDSHRRRVRPHRSNDGCVGKIPVPRRRVVPEDLCPSQPPRRLLPGRTGDDTQAVVRSRRRQILGAQAVGGAGSTSESMCWPSRFRLA